MEDGGDDELRVGGGDSGLRRGWGVGAEMSRKEGRGCRGHGERDCKSVFVCVCVEGRRLG